ncbi:MAG: hypothetical protein AAGA86_15165, partial [Bacteroidota bacterium]
GEQKVQVRFTDSRHSFPYALDIAWESFLPKPAPQCPIRLQTRLVAPKVAIGQLARMEVVVTNTGQGSLSMTTAIIGIPSGASLQPYQLKELLDTKQVDYYELFENQLVLYWKSMGPSEVKIIPLDLKAEIAGSYRASASTAYLYYGDEFKDWVEGVLLEVE